MTRPAEMPNYQGFVVSCPIVSGPWVRFGYTRSWVQIPPPRPVTRPAARIDRDLTDKAYPAAHCDE